ncbi:hypothetical protein CJ226_15535 [Microbacterium sp. UMB0228]|nr:hypothetical protein CJ226_15535 [Microbacterium sp. UMB0228]
MSAPRACEPHREEPALTELRVQLDRVSRAALNVLIADGISIPDAVRRALVEAAERYPEPDESDDHDAGTAGLVNWIASQVADAPPLTDFQTYVLHAAFVERRSRWLSEKEWAASRDSTDNRSARGSSTT